VQSLHHLGAQKLAPLFREMFASDPSRGRQQVEGVEIQFEPPHSDGSEGLVERKPDVDVVRGNIAIDKLCPLSDAYLSLLKIPSEAELSSSEKLILNLH
jgi:hypothetical protein